MQTFTQTFAGATTWKLNVGGRYFTTLGCSLPINVRLYKNGQKLALGDMTQLLAGLEVSPQGVAPGEYAFDAVEVDIAGADTVQIGIGNGDARYNRAQGNVAITNVNGAFAHAQVSVTNVDQVIVAASATRRHVEIQNNSAQVLRLVFDGTAASATKGQRVQPGGVWFGQPGFAPTTAIHAFMEVADATANNVEVITG